MSAWTKSGSFAAMAFLASSMLARYYRMEDMIGPEMLFGGAGCRRLHNVETSPLPGGKTAIEQSHVMYPGIEQGPGEIIPTVDAAFGSSR